jgi:hypothetical protein
VRYINKISGNLERLNIPQQLCAVPWTCLPTGTGVAASGYLSLLACKKDGIRNKKGDYSLLLLCTLKIISMKN